MNILEELKQKAEAKKVTEREQTIRTKSLERTYKKILLPRMQFMFDSLQELIKYLEIIQEPIVVHNYSQNHPQIGPLVQRKYKINTDGRMGFADYNRLQQINLNFYCEGPGYFEIPASNNNDVNKEYALLFDRGLRFVQKLKSNHQTVFSVERKIPVHFRILVDYPHSQIKVITFNHENFETLQKSFAAEEFDEARIEQLLCYLMRRNNDFAQDKRLETNPSETHANAFNPQQGQALNELAKLKRDSNGKIISETLVNLAQENANETNHSKKFKLFSELFNRFQR